jgi:hypothetical protein
LICFSDLILSRFNKSLGLKEGKELVMSRFASCVTIAIIVGVGVVPVFGQVVRPPGTLGGPAGTLLKIIHPSPSDNDEFGGGEGVPKGTAGTEGGKLLVGVRNDDTSGSNSGIAFLFDPVTGALDTTFNNPNPSGFANFGASVAGVGPNKVVIGSPNDDTYKTDAGAAYLFDTTGPTATLLATIHTQRPAKNGRTGDQFGISVASNGSIIAVGANRDLSSDTGAVFLYDDTGADISRIDNPEPLANDEFGWDLAMNDTHILVGAINDDGDPVTGVSNEGSAYLYDTAGNLLQTLRNPSPNTGDKFGWSVAFLNNAPGRGGPTGMLPPGTYAIVGSPIDGAQAGTVFLFDLNGNLVKTMNASGSNFGHDVQGIDGTNLIVAGGPRDDSPKTDGGAVFLMNATDGTIEHKYEQEDLNETQLVYLGNAVGVIQGADVAGGTGTPLGSIPIGQSRWDTHNQTMSKAGAVWTYSIPEPTTLSAVLALVGLTLASRRRRV